MENTNHPEKLNWTLLGLIQRLLVAIMADIDRSFTRFGLDYLPGQREAIQQIVTAILNFAEGKVVAIPLIPGGGKSTILRSILRVFSRFIAEGVEGILDYIGGIIVVVQTIAEMHALEAICREEAGNYPICAVLESRDFSLHKGGCIAGIATCKEECLWEDCDRFADCRFMKPAPDIKIPPILFIAHARYPNLVENPIKFQTWIDPDGNIRLRKLVVCDEGPEMTDIAPLDSTSMYDTSRMVSDINNFRFPDYVSFLWRKNVLNKFFKLLGVINENRNSKDAFGNITPAMMEEAGFCAEQFISVRDKLLANCKSPAAFQKADKVLNALSSERPKKYYTNNGKTTVFCPKLRELHGEGKPATFILDGTTHFNPELKDNQNIDVQDYAFTVNTSRLTVHVQRSNRVKFSKKASDSQKNYAAVLAWVKSILDEARGVHKQVMVITYQKYAARMFKDLADQYGDILIPFTTKDGKVFKKLPYFGGITGSNAYNQCTLIIMAGLNRYNPAEYLNRVIAISSASEKWASMAENTNEDKAQTMMDAMQSELLSNEVVQDFYRTDLRNHSSNRKVEAHFFQPPEAILSALRHQFPDASFCTISEIPEDAILASLDYKTYGPKQTHGASIEQFLRQRLSKDPESSVTPKEIQEGAGLSVEEYNTGMKSPELKKFIAEHFTQIGRGRHCKYAPHGSASKDAAS